MKTLTQGTALAMALSALATAATAEEITLRIGSGHPPGVVYTGLMINYFQPELKKRVEDRTDHTINFIEGYSGSVVKITEVFEAVQDGILDIGGTCLCFEPSNLPLHSFQAMAPFGTMDPVTSLQITEDVYKKVPYLYDVFEQKFNQKLIAHIADGGYNLATKAPWEKISDLKDRKVGGAGINLNWLSSAGVVPVTASFTTAYTDMSTGVYEGLITFPSAYLNLKFYEQEPHYTLIGFGSMSWLGLLVNLDTFNGLPDDVKPILLEVAKDYQDQTGIVNQAQYDEQIAKLRGLAKVAEIAPDVRQQWAESLQPWVAKATAGLESQGLPAKAVMTELLSAAEARGHKWPVRYKLD